MKKLLEELAFQMKMFENDMIDEQDFMTALQEIHEHYHYSYFEYDGKPPRYIKTYNEALKWFKKSQKIMKVTNMKELLKYVESKKIERKHKHREILKVYGECSGMGNRRYKVPQKQVFCEKYYAV